MRGAAVRLTAWVALVTLAALCAPACAHEDAAEWAGEHSGIEGEAGQGDRPEQDEAEEREPVALDDEDVVRVDCELRGVAPFAIHVVPSWSPLGAERFLDLVHDGMLNDVALFRAVEGFLIQWGITANQQQNLKWDVEFPDDPKIGVRIRRGTMAFAGSGKDSRSNQVFVALSDDLWPHLGSMEWETPFAYIDQHDMDAVIGQVQTYVEWLARTTRTQMG
jgi:cyclophilin family peptidyl-prolyl cis-trans isomerase